MPTDFSRFFPERDDSANVQLWGPDRPGVLRSVAAECAARGVSIRAVCGISRPTQRGADMYDLFLSVHGLGNGISALSFRSKAAPGLVTVSPNLAAPVCRTPLWIERAFPSRIGLVRDIALDIERHQGMCFFFAGLCRHPHHRFDVRLLAIFPGPRAAEACRIALHGYGGFGLISAAA